MNYGRHPKRKFGTPEKVLGPRTSIYRSTNFGVTRLFVTEEIAVNRTHEIREYQEPGNEGQVGITISAEW